MRQRGNGGPGNPGTGSLWWVDGHLTPAVGQGSPCSWEWGKEEAGPGGGGARKRRSWVLPHWLSVELPQGRGCLPGGCRGLQGAVNLTMPRSRPVHVRTQLFRLRYKLYHLCVSFQTLNCFL